jgi:predicted DNA-binding transcriptional regulator YafY
MPVSLTGAVSDTGIGFAACAPIGWSRLPCCCRRAGADASGGDDGPVPALVHLDMPRWFGGSEPVPWLRTLATAVRHRQQVRLGYQRGSTDDKTTRVICPLGLVNKAGVWYLVAAGGRRTAGGLVAAGGSCTVVGDAAAEVEPVVFRVGRVISADVLPAAFTRPASFDLAAFWSRWSDSFMSTRPKVEVLVRASPAALSAFGEVFGDGGQRALDAAPPADERGFREVALTFEHEAAAVHRLAGFGGQVEVLSPAGVRGRLIATARQLLERYQADA